MADNRIIHVVAAAIYNDKGQLLLARRPLDTHQGGLWEFPGGKREAGEMTVETLRRELQEELGILPVNSRPLIQVRHDYADRRVLLDVWRVEQFDGIAHGREGQAVQWVCPGDLDKYDFPRANLPVLKAVALADTYAISPAGDVPLKRILQQLEQTLEQGVRLVQLRRPHSDRYRFERMARAAAQLCEQYSARLLINGEPEQVGTCHAHGVHLNSGRLMALRRRPLGSDQLVGASCHNAQELAHACALEVDFVVCSPVLSTPSHPGQPGMGWDEFQQLAAAADVPVYALGGMQRAMLPEAWLHGGQGVAGIRGFWQS